MPTISNPGYYQPRTWCPGFLCTRTTSKIWNSIVYIEKLWVFMTSRGKELKMCSVLDNGSKPKGELNRILNIQGRRQCFPWKCHILTILCQNVFWSLMKACTVCPLAPRFRTSAWKQLSTWKFWDMVHHLLRSSCEHVEKSFSKADSNADILSPRKFQLLY